LTGGAPERIDFGLSLSLAFFLAQRNLSAQEEGPPPVTRVHLTFRIPPSTPTAAGQDTQRLCSPCRSAAVRVSCVRNV